MPNELKFCKDCKWMSEGSYPVCNSPRAELFTDLVLGTANPYQCETQRQSGRETMCGSEGRFWEAKEEQA